MLTLMLVASMLTLTGAGAASATWAPAYVERLTEPNVSVDPLPDSYQDDAAISSDGSTVFFESDASNLVAKSIGGQRQIFSAGVATGDVELVSLSSTGTPANYSCEDAAASGDGRYVAFYSEATNLVPNDVNSRSDIFLRDTTAGTIERISVHSDGTPGSGDSYHAAISDDGRYVAFESYAANLTDVDTNGGGVKDVFVRDRVSSETTLVSRASDGTQGNNHSDSPFISANGQYVVFESEANNLVPSDSNGEQDIFLRDLQSGETTIISQATDGTRANNDSYDADVSSDGRYVIFRSDATNLVPNDTNNDYDVFARDMTTGETIRVSVASDGTEADNDSYDCHLSDNGRYVTFRSTATNLVADDTNGDSDIFGHDMQTGDTIRVSVAADGSEVDGSKYDPAIDGDGSHVVFESSAVDLTSESDWNDSTDIFFRDFSVPTTIRLVRSADPIGYAYGDSEFSRISADGRYVVFHSDASNLVPGDTNDENDVFFYDRQTRSIELVSVSTTETQSNGCSTKPSVSADGRYVVFQSNATNLSPDDRTAYDNGVTPNGDIYLRDRVLGTTTLVSAPVLGVAPDTSDYNCAVWPSINASGTHVVYRSVAGELVDNDTNDDHDIFYYSIASGETTIVTKTYDGDQISGGGQTHFPAISADGRFVAFRSSGESSITTDPISPSEGGCGDTPPQIFVRDMQTGTNVLASISTSDSTAGKACRWPSLSGDGRYVAFQSGASNLVAGDTNDSADIFVRDLVSGETTRVSVATGGTEGDNCSSNPAISADGRWVTFQSYAENLVADDTNSDADIFVHDMETGETRRVSVAIDGAQSDDDSNYGKPSITADGGAIAFCSEAGNLVKGDEIDTNDYDQVYVASLWEVPVVPGVDRVKGTDRYATAIAASVENFDSADTVVLATGEDFPDALAASGLAGALDAPLLLTRCNGLYDGLAAELTRLGATDIILVGGENAVSADVKTTLEGLGYTVERIGGANRYATAALVAVRMETVLGGAFPGNAFVARGDTYPDALAAAPFAYSQGMPILLTRPDILSGEAAAALTGLSIEDAVVIGGVGAVSAPVATQVGALVSGAVTREAGSNRYATAVEVAERGIAEGWGHPWFVGVATGENFPDAFSGGASCGVNGGILLLTRPRSLPGEVASFLTTNADDVICVQVYGGALAVDVSVATAIAAIVD